MWVSNSIGTDSIDLSVDEAWAEYSVDDIVTALGCSHVDDDATVPHDCRWTMNLTIDERT